MNRRLSLIGILLIALCFEAGFLMLIAHWWGTAAATAVIAIKCIFVIWAGYELKRAYKDPDEGE